MKVVSQGEVYARKIESIPEGLAKVDPENGRYILGHSEKGHHHVLAEAGATLMERSTESGMKILYALLEEPNEIVQEAGEGAHAKIALDPGLYEFRIAREYDPFLEQARRVAD